MLSRVLRTITRHRLLGDSGARRVLCAVSGGPDSMAMLACLWELAPRLHLTLEVGVVDHGLRASAAAEIALVAERAAALGLPFHERRVDVAAARRLPRAGGVQEVARQLRLEALTQLAAERQLDRVALAHHADDQAETVLFRILRGTGLAGLAGIPYARVPFVRPLLDVTRAEIESYLGRRSLPFATDPSNADLRYARVRLRHQILPLLRGENPRISEALRRLAASAARDEPAGRAAAGVHVPGRVAEAIEAAAREGRGSRSFDVAGGRVTVSYGRVRVERGRSRPGTAAASSPALPFSISSAGWYPAGPATAVAVCDGGALPPGGPGGGHPDSVQWAWFDGDGLRWPLWVRPPRAGDRMFPRGGRGSRKLSDLLIDAKVPRYERPGLPVVTDGDGAIIFVPGLRPSRVGTPGAATRRQIGLAVVPISDHDASVDPSIASGNTQRYRDPKGLL